MGVLGDDVLMMMRRQKQTRLHSTGEVADILGVRLERLLYWERAGHIPKAARLGNGKRIYSESDVAFLRRFTTAHLTGKIKQRPGK